MTSPDRATRSPALTGQLIVWSFALVAGIVAAATPERFTWLAVVLGASMIIGFIWELRTHTKEGFMARIAVLGTGAFIIITLIAGVAGFFAALSY